MDLVHRAFLWADPLVLAGIVLLIGFLIHRFALARRPIARLLCQFGVFALFTALLVSGGLDLIKPAPAMDRSLIYYVSSAFKIIWWLAAASLLAGFSRAVLVFKRQPRETRFLQDLTVGFIYGAAALGIIGFVFDLPVSGLLAASGVVAIVLGLALQSTLGDVFSGIVLNLSKPYHPGDWVIFDGGTEGRIIETNWRATHILNGDNDLVIIPNSVIAKAKLVNATVQSKTHGITIAIRLEPTVSPARGRMALESALLSCNRIAGSPAPNVMVRSLDAVALECEVQFFVDSIEEAAAARSEVFDLIFRHCASAGIRLAPPTGSPAVLPPRPAHRDLDDMPHRLLEHLPIFAPLSDDERAELAPKMKRRTYKAGDTLLERGTIAQGLFILSAGVLAVRHGADSAHPEVYRLGPGDCFGQSSLLTGATMPFSVTALTKATVYEIAKDDLAPILKARPAIATELGLILARREAIERERSSPSSEPEASGDSLAGRIAERVKELFGLS